MAGGFEFTGGSSGRFDIRRRLGEGGMGVVYEAYDRERESTVAIKTLRRVDARSLIRFKTEFRALQDIEHPNLVSLGELIEDAGDMFFTMELVQGIDFFHYVCGYSDRSGTDTDISPSADTMQGDRISAVTKLAKRAHTCDEGRLRSALGQLALGLSTLHDAGKVHRDVKPSNIRVTPGGRVVLLDFGLVAELEPGRRSTMQNAVGTAEYMAPEQAASKVVGPASDWYSTGVLLYEVLTGALPFTGSSLTIMIDKQQREPEPPSKVSPTVSRELDELCTGLLRTDPKERTSGKRVLQLCDVSRVQQPGAISSQFTQTMPFVGREQELAELLAAYEATKQGAPVIIFVHGKSGLGKSELISRFADELTLREPNTVFLGGRCYERESLPYKAFDGVADALSRYMARLPDNEAAQLLPRRASLLGQLFPVMKRVEVIASAPMASGQPHKQDPHEQRTLMFTALRELFMRLSDRRRVVVFIDDLQWSDLDSLTLLGELLHPDDPPDMLLVCTVRPVGGTDHQPESPNWVPGAEHFRGDVRHIHLRELPDKQAADLIEVLAPTLARRKDIVDAILRESRGHPLFIQELVRRLEETGADIDHAAVRLEDALWSRIERMSNDARTVLDVVAVAGAPISREVAAAATKQSYTDFERAVSLLRIAFLARRGGLREVDTIEICHDRIRETVLARLNHDERITIHERIAIAMERMGAAVNDPQSLVVHLEACGNLKRAGQLSKDAAERAEAALAFDRAAHFYSKALTLGTLSEAEVRTLRMRLGQALINAGRGAEAADIYLAAAEGADRTTRLECQRHAAEQLLISGHAERGLEAVAGLLGEAGESLPASPNRALASVVWNRIKLRLRGLAWKERHLREIADADITRVDVYKMVGHGLALVDTVRGADYQLRALLLALRIGEPHRVGLTFLTEGVYQAAQGPRGAARGALFTEQGTALAERLQDNYLLAFSFTVRGTQLYFKGDLVPAVELLERGEHMMRAVLGATWELSTTRLFHIYSLRVRGALADLRACTEEYLRDAIRRGDRYMETTIRRCSNLAVLARDHVQESVENLERASWMPPTGVFHLQHWYEMEALGELALYRGTAVEAWAELAPKISALKRSLLLRIITTRTQSTWLAGRFALARNESPKSIEAMAKQLAKAGVPYASVWSSLLSAAVAHRTGDQDRAVQQLRAAIELADDRAMLLCANCARLQLAAIVQGDEGDVMTSVAHNWMDSEQIANVERMLAVVTPGFD